MDLAKEVNKGIGAHGMWKQRILDAIKTGKSEWEPKNVRTDNQCQFGKWLDSFPAGDKSLPSYKKVKELHAEFHKVAAGVLELALAGKKAEAESAIGANSEYVSASAALTKTMLDWKNGAA